MKIIFILPFIISCSTAQYNIRATMVDAKNKLGTEKVYNIEYDTEKEGAKKLADTIKDDYDGGSILMWDAGSFDVYLKLELQKEFDIISRDSIDALIQNEKRKDMMGCDTVECEIGGALDADYVLKYRITLSENYKSYVQPLPQNSPQKYRYIRPKRYLNSPERREPPPKYIMPSNKDLFSENTNNFISWAGIVVTCVGVFWEFTHFVRFMFPSNNYTGRTEAIKMGLYIPVILTGAWMYDFGE